MKRVVLEYLRGRGFRDAFWLCLGAGIQLLRGLTHGYWPVFIGRGVRITARSTVKIGRFTRIEDFVELDGYGNEGLVIGARCKIGKYSLLKVAPSPHVFGAGIRIASHTALAEFCYVGGAALVTIGENCAIGQYVSIHPQDHLPWQEGGVQVRSVGIEIGSDNWIGAKSTLLDGCSLGSACMVAAGAVVRGRFGDRVLIAGVPAVEKKRLHAPADRR